MKVRAGSSEERLEGRTLLHVLVEQLEGAAPDLLSWAVSLLAPSQAAPKALIGLLGFFPKVMERLRLLEAALTEAEVAGEASYFQRLKEIHLELTQKVQVLAGTLLDLDRTLRFFGGASAEEDDEQAAVRSVNRLYLYL